MSLAAREFKNRIRTTLRLLLWGCAIFLFWALPLAISIPVLVLLIIEARLSWGQRVNKFAEEEERREAQLAARLSSKQWGKSQASVRTPPAEETDAGSSEPAGLSRGSNSISPAPTPPGDE